MRLFDGADLHGQTVNDCVSLQRGVSHEPLKASGVLARERFFVNVVRGYMPLKLRWLEIKKLEPVNEYFSFELTFSKALEQI